MPMYRPVIVVPGFPLISLIEKEGLRCSGPKNNNFSLAIPDRVCKPNDPRSVFNYPVNPIRIGGCFGMDGRVGGGDLP